MIWTDGGSVFIEASFPTSYLRSYAACDRDLEPVQVLEILSQVGAVERLARELGSPFSLVCQDALTDYTFEIVPDRRLAPGLRRNADD